MHRQILLTGATGALGPALAAELVRTGAAERVAVLMRGAEIGDRFEKWRGAVRELLLPGEHAGLERLFPVAGDICEEGLGIEGKSGDLRSITDVVIHAAADTTFAAPSERQWNVNVGGTERMLRWAGECGRLKRFLLVSSVFVSGSRTGRIDETATAEAPDFVTYYQRTKWESERVALASGLPVGVARVSLVLGSHATGSVHRPGAVHSLIKWFARGLMPLVPGNAEARGDVIATEMAARCLARAVVADWGGRECGLERKSPELPSSAAVGERDGKSGDLRSNGRPIWHIAAAEEAPRMTELMDFVYEHFERRPAWRKKGIPRPQMVEQGVFDRFIESVEGSGHPVAAQALRSVNRFLPELLFPKTYVRTQAEALWGGPLPQYDWRETMERVIRFCCPEKRGEYGSECNG
jgi:nucleoside-diphosphate-sugar epimerase